MNVFIYGAGGHAKVVAEIIRLNGGHVVGFIDSVNKPGNVPPVKTNNFGNKGKFKRAIWGILSSLIGSTPRSLQWDSFRFWECLAFACCPIHLDLDKYGVDLPIIPKNWEHYIGLDLDYLERDLERLRKNPEIEFSKACLSFVFGAFFILVPLQIFMGDNVGVKVHETQPLKTAAMEGVWDTQSGAPLLLFAYPNQSEQRNQWTVSIPYLASLVNTHQWNGTLIGLKTVPVADQPFVAAVFYAFRVMVGLEIVMLLMVIAAAVLRIRGRLYHSRWFLRACVCTTPIGFAALWCGWIVAEVGRQPWVVYNILRTADAASPVTVSHILITLVLLIIVYGIMFGIFYLYFLVGLIAAGPSGGAHVQQPFAYLPPDQQEK